LIVKLDITGYFWGVVLKINENLKNAQDVQNQTVFGSIMFGFIIFSIIWSTLLSN
jgi:hypothetical protein